MVLALVLADLLPEKHDAIIAHAPPLAGTAWKSRGIIPQTFMPARARPGHCQEFKKSSAFREDFDAVKAELMAAQK